MEDYIRLAALQGRHPQDFAVFRRHLSLQAFSLLRQQNEIAHLEQILGTYVTAARGATEAASVLSGLALHRSQDRSPDEAEQLRLWDELEAKLKLYGESLLRFDALCRLSSIDRRSHRKLMDWLTDPDGGKDGFHHVEGEFWNEEHLDDLAALGAISNKSTDILTEFVGIGIVGLYHRIFGHKHRERISIDHPFTEKQQTTAAWKYSERNTEHVINAINTITASSIISLSALALYFIPSIRARLGAIVAFTFAFSVALVLMTGASRAECFVATAAYAAVLVVFVGTDAVNNSSNT